MKKVLDFIKTHKMPLIMVVLWVFTWLYIVLQPAPITAKEIQKHDNEMVNLILHKVGEEINVIKIRVKSREGDIKNLGILLDSLNLVQDQNRQILKNQLYQLKKMENEIKIGNYKNASDSILLQRLRAND